MLQIGAGGYGEVWLARNTATGTFRAVKIVHRSTFTDARPFQREFEGLLKFEAVSRAHPSQLALFHVGRNEGEGYFYYVMELADARPGAINHFRRVEDPSTHACNLDSRGADACSLTPDYSPHTLRSDLENGRLPATRVLEFGLSLTEALTHLHAKGLVHRDVKPSNIIFVSGLPKLADIGLVTDASDVHSMVGTEGYLPLEGPGTPAADIFALGKVLYEALTGLDRRQFPELPADLRRWPDAALAFELNAVVVKACVADARQRYASAEAMQADLARLATGGSVKRRRAWLQGAKWTSIAAGLAAMAILAVFGGRRWIDSERQRGSAQQSVGWTTNQGAAKAYQLGNFFAKKLITPETLNVSRKHLEEAVRLDPNFAQAYELLATVYNREPGWGTRLGKDAFPKGRAFAQRAIDLTPGLGWAHGELAWGFARYDYDWRAAEQASLKALDLSPNNSSLRVGYALQVLLPLGRFAEAEQHYRKAMETNATDWGGPSDLGALFYYQGHFEEALAYFDQAADLEPRAEPHRLFRARTLECIPGRRAEAIRAYRTFLADQGSFKISTLRRQVKQKAV